MPVEYFRLSVVLEHSKTYQLFWDKGGAKC